MAIDMNKLMQNLQNKRRELVKNEKPATPKLGVTKIVLMPGWNPENREVFWREFGAHYIKGVDGKVASFYPCDDVIYQKPCPVCQALAQASRATHDEGTLEQIKQCRANKQYLVNAIVIGENNNDPVVFSLSKTAFEQLINVIGSWAPAVFEPTKPQVIQIDRSGTGFDTKYLVSVTPETFPLPADALNKMKNLDEYVAQRTEQMTNRSLLAIEAFTGVKSAIAYQPAQVVSPAQVAQAVPPVTRPAPQPAMNPADIPSAGTPWQAPPAAPTYAAPQVPPTAQAATSIPMDAEMEQLLSGLDGI